MRLSVVIPVYRVEQTLERCVKSVLAQDVQELEVILVDDGSPDSCGAICDRLASVDARIKVVHKANGGLSDARNHGLDLAYGDYVTFVDSDDFIAENTYKPLMDVVSQHPEYDIVEYPVFVHYGSRTEYKLLFDDVEYFDVLEYFLKGKAYAHSYAWNKIYRRSLFAGVRFPVGRVFEDIQTLPSLLEKTKVVATVSVGMYYYCWNEAGITCTADGNKLAELLDAHARIIERIGAGCSSSPEFLAYYMHVLNIQCDVCRMANAAPSLPKLKFPLGKGIAYLLKHEGKVAAFKFALTSVSGIGGLLAFNKLRHVL